VGGPIPAEKSNAETSNIEPTKGLFVKRTITARVPAAAVAMAAAIALTACTIAGTATPASTSSTVPVVPPTATSAMQTDDPAAVRSASMASVASAQAVADKAAADKAAADKAAADQSAADQSAAEQSAAAQSAAAKAAAEQAAAEQAAAEEAAAEQAAADAAAAEQSAAEQAAADQASADADAAASGWYTPSGNWVSPETAARALAAGIAPGETVPNYLRCGTICGEGPTSGEVQRAHACKDGLMSAEECAGIDPDAIIAAASSYSGG